jgi:hypothetical protein
MNKTSFLYITYNRQKPLCPAPRVWKNKKIILGLPSALPTPVQMLCCGPFGASEDIRKKKAKSETMVERPRSLVTPLV